LKKKSSGLPARVCYLRAITKKTAAPKVAQIITSPKIKTLASAALNRPSQLTTAEIRELGGSILRHLEK
jgi:hypothetical protein